MMTPDLARFVISKRVRPIDYNFCVHLMSSYKQNDDYQNDYLTKKDILTLITGPVLHQNTFDIDILTENGPYLA